MLKKTVTSEIATIEIFIRNEIGGIVHVRQKGIETETGAGAGTETDMLDKVVSWVAGAMSHEIETGTETGNLLESGEEMRAEKETIGTPGAEEEGGEIGREVEGTGNDLEKRMMIGGLQEVEVRHVM